MKMTLTFYLVLALALSLLSAGGLAWRVAGEGPRCREKMVTAALVAIKNERDRAARADKEAGRIVQKTRADTGNNVRTAQEGSNEREQALRTVVVRGDCRMPAGLPSIQGAIDAANAAAGD